MDRIAEGRKRPASDTMPPVMMVASTGGHLAQLIELDHRISLPGERRWVSFEGPQSTSALDPTVVDFVPYIPPRGLGRVIRTLPIAFRILRRHRPSAVVSTGSAVAVAFLPLARIMGIPAYYIESATRADGPSLTGKILARMPGIKLFTQHQATSTEKWRFAGSVFDGFRSEPVAGPTMNQAVVTLGTMETYGFRRLVERLVKVLPSETTVLWQTGATDVEGLRIAARTSVPSAELERAIAEADLIITHAGTGTALTCMRAGKIPLLVPRRAEYGEHVDDHQLLTATYLTELGLAIVAEADQLDIGDLQRAAAARIVRDSTAEPIILG